MSSDDKTDADQILYGGPLPPAPPEALDFPDLINSHKIVVDHLELVQGGHFQDINGYSGGRNWAVKNPRLPTAWKAGSDYLPTQARISELVATAMAMEQGSDAKLEFMGWPTGKVMTMQKALRDTTPAVAEGRRAGFMGRDLLMMREADGSPFFTPIDQMAAIEHQCGHDSCHWHRVIDDTGFDNVAYTVCCKGTEVLGIIRY